MPLLVEPVPRDRRADLGSDPVGTLQGRCAGPVVEPGKSDRYIAPSHARLRTIKRYVPVFPLVQSPTRSRSSRNSMSVVDPNWAGSSNIVPGEPARSICQMYHDLPGGPDRDRNVFSAQLLVWARQRRETVCLSPLVGPGSPRVSTPCRCRLGRRRAPGGTRARRLGADRT